MELARKHNLWVVEDCAQSPGATYKGKKVGTIGHVGTFSTISGKITSTGEGGFVITNDDDLYDKMWGYMDFARTLSGRRVEDYWARRAPTTGSPTCRPRSGSSRSRRWTA